MKTCECDWCGELFWSDDPDQGMCLTCRERDSEQQNSERAVEQWLAYIQSLRGQAKSTQS